MPSLAESFVSGPVNPVTPQRDDRAELAAELPVRVYSPEPAIQHPAVLMRDLWRDLMAGRELAWRLFTRDLKAQYRQTYLGYIWAFLPPLVASLTFIFLQSQGIVDIDTGGIPYAAFAMMGTLLWQTFVDAMQSPLTAVTAAKPMLAKINFPREAVLVAGLYMVVFNFLIRLLMLVGVMAAWRVTPSATIIFFPFAMLSLLLCGFAIGMALVPTGGLYGDVARGIPIIAQFWMLLTPVVYPARSQGLAGWLAVWNPVSPLIETARATLTGQRMDLLPAAILVSIIAALIAIGGLVAFRIVMPRLIERMGG